MTRISARYTFFIKRIAPFAWAAYLAWVFATTAHDHLSSQRLPLAIALLSLLMTVVLVFDLRARAKLADEVYDDTDCLLVRRGHVEATIPLAAISDVSTRGFFGTPRITLTLGAPGAFGSKIEFLPVPLMSFGFASKSDVAEDLLVRADRARTNARMAGPVERGAHA